MNKDNKVACSKDCPCGDDKIKVAKKDCGCQNCKDCGKCDC